MISKRYEHGPVTIIVSPYVGAVHVTWFRSDMGGREDLYIWPPGFFRSLLGATWEGDVLSAIERLRARAEEYAKLCARSSEIVDSLPNP